MTDAYGSYEAWVASRPVAIQALIAQYPPGPGYVVEGHACHLIGYTEAEDGAHQLILTPEAPYEAYEVARAVEFRVDPPALRRVPRRDA